MKKLLFISILTLFNVAITKAQVPSIEATPVVLHYGIINPTFPNQSPRMPAANRTAYYSDGILYHFGVFSGYTLQLIDICDDDNIIFETYIYDDEPTVGVQSNRQTIDFRLIPSGVYIIRFIKNNFFFEGEIEHISE